MWVHSMWVNSLQDNRRGGVRPVKTRQTLQAQIWLFVYPPSAKKKRLKLLMIGETDIFNVSQYVSSAASSMKDLFILSSVELEITPC